MYDDLLSTLLGTDNHRLKLQDVQLTNSSLRTGLNAALKRLNATMQVCGIPEVEGKVSVSTQRVDGVAFTIIEVVTASPSKTLPFTIVED